MFVQLGTTTQEETLALSGENSSLFVHNVVTDTTYVIRSTTRGDAGKALQAVGVALGPTVRVCNDD